LPAFQAGKINIAFCESVLTGKYPDRVHEAGNVAKHRQHDVWPEMHSETHFEEYSEGRDENGEDDAQNV